MIVVLAPSAARSEEADPPDKALGPAAVRLVEVETEGGLDDHDVVTALTARLEDLRRCFGDRRKTRPELEGFVSFAATVDRSGKVTAPRLVSSSLGDGDTEKCANDHAAALVLQKPPPGGSAKLRYKLAFTDSFVRGALPKQVIRGHIRKNLDEFRECYERELRQQPGLKGQIAVRFVIGPSGAVQSSAVASSTMGNTKAETCVAATMQRIVFPPPEGGGVVIVTYPFMFQEQPTPP